jgi:predicted alpha/beta-fold hydrolase
LDDPLIHNELIPYDATKKNEKIIVLTTKRGGHISWLEGVMFPSVMEVHWHERLALEYCEAHITLAKQRTKSQ